MSRIDVGGNRAGTQTGYTAYGLNGQVRVSVEGINTTEGTGGAGFYFDYGSFEEVFLGVAGQGAEAATPGVQSQFLGKSGGNRFSGEFYVDGYNNAFQGSNLTDEHIDHAFGLRPRQQRSAALLRRQRQRRRPDQEGQGLVPLLVAQAVQRRRAAALQLRLRRSTPGTPNPSAKVTYQLNQNHKLIGYYQWNMKMQPTRLPLGTYTYDNIGPTTRQESPSWVWKGEWNGTLSDKLYLEARYGDFGYYDPRSRTATRTTSGATAALLILTGAHAESQNDRDRKQLTGAATYFLDTKRGSHTFKFGGEMYLESQWGGRTQNVGGNIEHIYNNSVPSQVVFGIPTALCVSGLKASDDGDLLVVNKLDQQDVFLNDTWSMGRVTLNLGVRWDRYRGWMPEQRADRVRDRSGQRARADLRRADVLHLELVRAARRHHLRPGGRRQDGDQGELRTVLAQPRPGRQRRRQSRTRTTRASPIPGTTATAIATTSWARKSARRRRPRSPAPSSSIPNITQPYSHDVSVYLERQIAARIGARVGFVYKTEDDLIAQYNPGRPISAYTVRSSFVDLGPDGRHRHGRRRDDHALGVPSPQTSTRASR